MQNRGCAPPPRVSPVRGRSSGGVQGVLRAPGRHTHKQAGRSSRGGHSHALVHSKPAPRWPAWHLRPQCWGGLLPARPQALPPNYPGPGEPLASRHQPLRRRHGTHPRTRTHEHPRWSLQPRQCSATRNSLALSLPPPRWGVGHGAGCGDRVAYGTSRESTGLADSPARGMGQPQWSQQPRPETGLTTRLPGAGKAASTSSTRTGDWHRVAQAPGHHDRGAKCGEPGGPCRRRAPQATTELQPQRAAREAVGEPLPGRGAPGAVQGCGHPRQDSRTRREALTLMEGSWQLISRRWRFRAGSSSSATTWFSSTTANRRRHGSGERCGHGRGARPQACTASVLALTDQSRTPLLGLRAALPPDSRPHETQGQ